MFEHNLENLLRQITLQAIAQLIGNDEDIANLLFALTEATSTRQIVGCVQFEEDWQATTDEGVTWYAHCQLKVAPSVCAVAYGNGDAVNELVWEFAIPNVNHIEVSAKPTNTIDYLAMGKIVLDRSDDEDCDECESKDYIFQCLSNVLESMGS